MAKKPRQKLKLLYILKILLDNTDEQHGYSVSEIINALQNYDIEAERKSIYDDIEALKLFGIDIIKVRSDTVKYHIVSRNFQFPELKLLVDAVQSSKFITRKKSDELIKKIESLTSVYEAKLLQRQVFVANRIKTMNESIYNAVDYIHTAISENLKISFKYFDWNVKKEKELKKNGELYNVSPWALTWDDENYYLIAYDSNAQIIKHYRVDKMLNISLLKAPREGSEIFKNFDMAVYSKQTFGMYGGRFETVKLLCENELAGRIIDRFGRDVMLIPYDDHHFTVNVNVAISPLFLTWLMNFKNGIKILSPENVIEEFKATAKAALEQYN